MCGGCHNHIGTSTTLLCIITTLNIGTASPSVIASTPRQPTGKHAEVRGAVGQSPHSAADDPALLLAFVYIPHFSTENTVFSVS